MKPAPKTHLHAFTSLARLDFEQDGKFDIELQVTTENGGIVLHASVLPGNTRGEEVYANSKIGCFDNPNVSWVESVAAPVSSVCYNNPQKFIVTSADENNWMISIDDDALTIPLSSAQIIAAINAAYNNVELHETVITQGGIADCYVIGALNAHAINIRDMVQENADHSYTVQLGHESVNVTNEEIAYYYSCLPDKKGVCKKLQTTGSGHYGYILHAALIKDRRLLQLPENWTEGGFPQQVLGVLSGVTYINVETREIEPDIAHDLLSQMKYHAMTASTSPSYVPSKAPNSPKVAQHTYSLLRYDEEKQEVFYSDPHDPYNVHQIPLKDFLKAFQTIQLPEEIYSSPMPRRS